MIQIPYRLYLNLTNPPSQFQIKRYSIPKKDVGMPVIVFPVLTIPKIYRHVEPIDIMRMKYFNICSIQKWFEAELEIIRSVESKVFSSKDSDFQIAGGKKLEGFKQYNIIRAISKDDISQESKVLDYTYERILNHLYYSKLTSEIEEQMIKLQSKKNSGLR